MSTDYLMGLTEQKNHPDAGVSDLHLSDETIHILEEGKFNHRMLSELICHEDFQKFLVDCEIFVDRIADMRINDLNVLLEAVRQKIIAEHNPDENDVYTRTLNLAQVNEYEYFSHVISEDIMKILQDIREAHKSDKTTAEDNSVSAKIMENLNDVMNFEGSDREKMAASMLASIGIDYTRLTKEEFVTQMRILEKSEYLKTPLNQRGKRKYIKR